MQKIDSTSTLSEAILELEARKAEEGRMLKEQVNQAYESIKPINLIKNTIKEALDSQDLRTDVISTEDKIEITSPKEIVLTAGGSQLKINGDGIFTTTGGKFESKAGQHSFVGGAKVSYEVPD